MSTQTIEELQAIVADENRPAEEREIAAKHILTLQGHTEELAQQDSKAERRSQFSGAQQRFAGSLALGNKAFDIIEGNSSVTATMDKLVVMQIVKLMLDSDGNDGIIYAATNWNSSSKQSLADRMGDHKSQHECNPAYRLGMQSQEDQTAYWKRECGTMRIPYVDPVAEKKLEDAVKMSSKEFAEFAVSFHRKSLGWELKQFIYSNLNLRGTAFFPAFVALQKKSDDAEEVIYKGAYAAHLLATDPNAGEEDAQGFLDMLSYMRGLEKQESERSAERIAKRAPAVEIKPEAVPEPEPEPQTDSTVPWYLQESYLKEKQQKDQAGADTA